MSAEDLNEITGLEPGDGEADDVMGSQTCQFTVPDGSGMAMVQWAAGVGDFDATLEATQAAYENPSDAEPPTIPGSAQAGGYTGELMSSDVAGL